MLLDAQSVMDVDQTLIQSLLIFIQGQQQADGSFSYNSDADLHRGIGYANDREQVQTARITAVLIKSSNGRHNDVINKCLQYLRTEFKKPGIYKNVIIAFTFAISSRNATMEIDEILNTPFTPSTTPEYFEIASSLLMTKDLLRKEADKEVKWMWQQASSLQGFYSSFHTAVALKALLEYTKDKDQASLIRKLENVNVESTVSNKTDSFKIEADLIEGQKDKAVLNVNTQYLGNLLEETNLILMEVEVPRGYKYVGYKKQEYIKVRICS